MAVNLVNTKISTQVLHFKPGGSPVSFEVTVVNESNQFASFQLEIIAAGGSSSLGSNWYNISPAVSAKNPPGDTTKFYVTITDTPVAGFVGKMNLIVRIFSLELRDEDRQLLRLVVEVGTNSVPMLVELPVREFSAQPQTLIEIPVRVVNPGQIPTTVSLRFCGLNPQWLLDGVEKLLQVAPGAKVETSFLCQLPVPEEVPTQAYSFTIEATHLNGLPSRSSEGVIKVIPGGFIDFQCIPEKQRIPPSRSWLPQWRINSTTYLLECKNASNLSQQVHIQIKKGEEEQPKCFLEFQPEAIDINPGETKHLQLLVSKRRWWFGLAKKFSFIVKAIASDKRVNINNENQFLQLTIHPVLHPWLQLLLGFLLLYIVWAVSWLNPANPLFGHHRSVTSVQFNGVGDRAISGSQDQSIIRWNIAGFTNLFINQQHGKIAKNIGKAVRVVRYKPVDNDVVAAGLENGEIQIWSVLSGTKKSITTFTLNKTDRVLALEFSPDSRFLFSGHGSGSVLQWDANNALLENTPSITKPIKSQDVKFSVYGLALVGQDRQNLAIGGRYNNLEVWNLIENKLWKVPYNPPGSQNDYIVSLDSSEYRPNLLATSDNKGQITLWNMQTCLNSKNNKCQVLDRWSDGHGGKAVRSVAISDNGCYLVSGGDDNRVMLWSLTKEGRRAFPNGIQVRSDSHRFNSVDVKVVKDRILIISGNDNTEVMLNIIKFDKNPPCKK
ncbi:hypothetical protein A6770_05290 [Nostoc minutum NIES-26]|uniref:Uncharacterized protein n=1 Tax=Nostoc minutum NIES-26 TaxID=1844469 RepID=A0A367Q708_9NOSO|nr:hypothetical protein A6770_05290 [Nostoc minutum NIES-26]